MNSTSTVRDAGESVLLTDGRRVTLRPLGADDAAALIDAVEHADPWDLRRRFMGAAPAPATLARQLTRADGFHDLALGAFASDGRLVGVAQFDRVDDEPHAEVAIEVAHDWQHNRLGFVLLAKLAALARERGVHEFTAVYFADNFAIRNLLRRIGKVVTSGYDQGTGYSTIDLDSIA